MHTSLLPTHRAQVAAGDGESDGQRRRAFDVIAALVTDAEHDEHQDERDEELDAERLERVQQRVDGGHAERALDLLRCQRLRGGGQGGGCQVVYRHG